MRITRIVVGVDFSAASDLAVRHATALAHRTGASLVLLHVGAVPDAPTGIPPSMEATARAYREVLDLRIAADRKRLDAQVQQVAALGIPVNQKVVDGFADTALADAGQDLGADLIIVGTHGRTGIRRWLLGSVSEKTVRLAGCSVLVVRGADEHHPTVGGFQRIVVGIDFSPHGDDALQAALDVAAPGADVHVVHCWQAPGPELGVDTGDMAPYHDRVGAEMASYHEQLGQELMRKYGDAPVALRFEALHGSPAATLDDVAKSRHADLIVVGSHGRRGVRLLLLGSVAEATVRHAPCSVLVARA